MYKSFGFNCLAFAQKRASISKTNPNLWCLFFTEWGMEFCPKSIQIFLVLLEFTKEVICVSHTAKRLLSSRVKFKCFCKWKAHFQTSVCFDCWNVYKTMSQSQHKYLLDLFPYHSHRLDKIIITFSCSSLWCCALWSHIVADTDSWPADQFSDIWAAWEKLRNWVLIFSSFSFWEGKSWTIWEVLWIFTRPG